MDDEQLGRMVRAARIRWALEQPDPEPAQLVPWEYLAEPEREAARRIGRRLFQAGVDFERGRLSAGLVIEDGAVVHDPAMEQFGRTPGHEDSG